MQKQISSVSSKKLKSMSLEISIDMLQTNVRYQMESSTNVLLEKAYHRYLQTDT